MLKPPNKPKLTLVQPIQKYFTPKASAFFTFGSNPSVFLEAGKEYTTQDIMDLIKKEKTKTQEPPIFCHLKKGIVDFDDHKTYNPKNRTYTLTIKAAVCVKMSAELAGITVNGCPPTKTTSFGIVPSSFEFLRPGDRLEFPEGVDHLDSVVIVLTPC